MFSMIKEVVIRVSTYYKSCVFLPDNNVIYSVGCNDEGQLGTGDLEHHTIPQTVELEGEPGPIKQVSAGSNHTAILTGIMRKFA